MPATATPNYNAASETDDSHQRVFSVHIDNPLMDAAIGLTALPSFVLCEEVVHIIGGRKISENVGTLSRPFDPTNPRHGLIYYYLNLEYEEMRTERDAAVLVAV